MSPTPAPWATTTLLVDDSDLERTYFAQGLMRCSSDYLVLEATSGQSGMDLYRGSQRIDCVVLELDLPNSSGFALLVDLLPRPSRPNIAVVVLTRVAHNGWWDLARRVGVHACLFKPYTSAEDLDKAIQRAIALVGLMPK
ncbi:MAG: response regulator, partial [Nitrospiraceae bacterium]